jgi:hypothetical protein
MQFRNELAALSGSPISRTQFISGSIFHLYFTVADSEAALICNGCQWGVMDDNNKILLHDEDTLSNDLIREVFSGRRLRAANLEPALISLSFDDFVFHAFVTEDYHLYLHDGVALHSPEWQKISAAARHGFMLSRAGQETEGFDFGEYYDLDAVSWGDAYLKAREARHG